MRYKVICVNCQWRGRRSGLECACYDEWAAACRPWATGPGCPSSILYPCPHCGKRTITVYFSIKGTNGHLKAVSKGEELLKGLYETPRDF